MGKLLISILFLFASLTGFGQSESHNFYTRDTIIKPSTGFPSLPGGSGIFYAVRISSPIGDTVSRPAFIHMNGAGEVSTDTNNLKSYASNYGIFYWINHGWDGGVQLANGKHFPILVTIAVSVANVRPQYISQLVDSLSSWYHLKRGSLHFSGLSMGAWTWGRMLCYSSDGTETHAMSQMRSIVALEGLAYDNFNGVSFGTNAYRKWVQLYDGRYFALEGTNDTRQTWIQRDSMVQAGSTKAYFSMENIGGGGHCCWNSMLDPSANDWRNIDPITNVNIVKNANHPNSMGNYIPGESIFQWQLRQGDTTLIGGDAPTVDAGPAQTINLPTSTATLTATASGNGGHTISSYAWSKISGPSGGAITSPSSASTGITGLIAGIYTYQVLVTDNASNTTADNVQITVVALIPPSVSAGGNHSVTLPSNSITLAGSASPNGSASSVSVAWSLISGPNTPTIASKTALTTVVSGMIQGSYVFRLTATDDNGNTNYDQATITVLNAGSIERDWPTMGPGEYQNVWLDANKHIYGLSSNLETIGITSGGTPGILNALTTSPANMEFDEVDGGLHFIAAVDTAGYAHTAGDFNASGTGPTGGDYRPLTRITVDSLGNAMRPIDHLTSYFYINSDAGWYGYGEGADSFYVWGPGRGGAAGDGSYGPAARLRPISVVVPGGDAVKKIVAGTHTMLLATNGDVWSWGQASAENLGYAMTGTQYLTPRLIATGAKDIAGGGGWNWIVFADGSVRAFGFSGGFMGAINNGIRYGSPTDVTADITNYLDGTIKEINVNDMGTYFLTTKGKLYFCGDNAQGNLGNGQELDYSATPSPYAWNFALYQLPVRHPTLILPAKSNWKHVYNIYSFDFYTFAVDSTGQWYSWGRNKSAVLANGKISASADIESAYANAWDVPWATPVDPFGMTTAFIATCPYCITNPSSTPCSQYTIPSNIAPIPNAGPTQNISTDNTTLDGSASTDNVHISSYLWTQISGPVAATIAVPSARVTTVSGLSVSGSYVFQLKCTDNGWLSSTSTVTVNVGASTATPCNCIITTNKKFQP